MDLNKARVYVVSTDDMEENFHCSAHEISAWEDDEVLCEDAQHFIELAEKYGRVYSSACTFIDAFNEEEISDSMDFVFITDKY